MAAFVSIGLTVTARAVSPTANRRLGAEPRARSSLPHTLRESRAHGSATGVAMRGPRPRTCAYGALIRWNRDKGARLLLVAGNRLGY